MSCSTKLLSLLVRRCVAVRQLTLSAASQTRGDVLSARCRFIQQRTWTSTTRTVCLPRLHQLQSAMKSSQSSFCTKAETPCDDEYPPLPAYDPEPEKREVYVIQVIGFPWSCSAQDLLQFFSECRIRDGVKGIHLVVDKTGRPPGQAFIELEHKEDVNNALEKHGQFMGPRYVEVYEVTNRDAEVILKKQFNTEVHERVVRLRGLPYSCTEADIVQFFSGLDIMENGITFVKDYSKRRNSGEAFVQFSTQEAADEALQRDRRHIGNRYIEVFPSRSNEIYSEKTSAPPQPSPYTTSRRNASLINRPRPLSSSAPQSHYVHMRGLPFEATGEDIVRFFSPLVVSKILIECGPQGKPSGEASIYFSCHQDAVAAMSRDREFIGDRYIELFLNTGPE
ncbi:G-rich sequence factor 1 [Morone saxatilis]|uniref:G-rich sequence factor 1 n=1 Tax=Morone saxatilis TaxID=34816 RepID=UPI0015E1E563|nr:G-rich sequence factor 1 [Morone saxatilis]XP_035513757.1 G-rich sequence factor 1 [Morone saxatilis]